MSRCAPEAPGVRKFSRIVRYIFGRQNSRLSAP
jgi:hypothetical protein